MKGRHGAVGRKKGDSGSAHVPAAVYDCNLEINRAVGVPLELVAWVIWTSPSFFVCKKSCGCSSFRRSKADLIWKLTNAVLQTKASAASASAAAAKEEKRREETKNNISFHCLDNTPECFLSCA